MGNTLSWRFIVSMTFSLLLALPIAFVLGITIANIVFASPVTAAYGWLLYLLPINAIGGLVIGLVEALVFNVLYVTYSHKQAWIVLMVLMVLVAIANSYLILLPGLLTFFFNLIILQWCQRFLVRGSRQARHNAK